MDEDVADERAHEHERGGGGILDVDDPGLFRAMEVAGHDPQSAAGRTVFGARLERQNERPLRVVMELYRDVLRNRVRRERNPSHSEISQNDARIGRRVNGLEVEHALRQRDRRAHRVVEEGLLRSGVAEESRRRHAELSGDVCQSGGVEASGGEAAPGGVEQLVPSDAWWSAHL
jgi:hypothetical protein